MLEHQILINFTPQETRVAIVEESVVKEIHIERTAEASNVGNIYLGKVVRVLPGMQSAFIDIGLERTAFLYVADLWGAERYQALENYYAQHAEIQDHVMEQGKSLSNKPIEKQLFEGQSLVVQVLKDQIANKGARLTTQLSLAGRWLVFLPNVNHIGISQRIEQSQREHFRTRLEGLIQQLNINRAIKISRGFIFRTNAAQASDEELSEDILYLHKVWQEIKTSSTKVAVKSLIRAELNLAQRIIRDMLAPQTSSIEVDNQELLAQLTTFVRNYIPALQAKLKFYNAKQLLFARYSVDKALAEALNKKVALKSGGYLIIEQTEALTTVDVNTGAYTGKKGFADTVFKTNLEATHELARQLRLRNLGGIIIVDFIDMSNEDAQQAILVELRKKLSLDRVKTTAGEFSALGLVELTRKRTRESLVQVLCEQCKSCAGRGVVKTIRTVAYQILYEIEREASLFEPKSFRIIAAPEVTELLLDEENQYLTLLTEKINKPILLQSNSYMAQEDFDIVLN